MGTGNEADLYSKELVATDWKRIGNAPTLPLQGNAKIRYRQEDQQVAISALNETTMNVSFDKPQRAVASGQIVAAYQ